MNCHVRRVLQGYMRLGSIAESKLTCDASCIPGSLCAGCVLRAAGCCQAGDQRRVRYVGGPPPHGHLRPVMRTNAALLRPCLWLTLSACIGCRLDCCCSSGNNLGRMRRLVGGLVSKDTDADGVYIRSPDIRSRSRPGGGGGQLTGTGGGKRLAGWQSVSSQPPYAVGQVAVDVSQPPRVGVGRGRRGSRTCE